MSSKAQTGWFDSAPGAYLLAQEQALFDSVSADIFGFNAVQVGVPELPLLAACRVPHKWMASAHVGEVRCEPDQLPFQSASIDLLLMPHVLEFSADSHQTLREAERVLVPEGTLLLSGFNPMSAWGFKRKCNDDAGFPWNGKFLSLLRIKDWLALLGFEVESVRMACYAPPFENAAWIRRFEWLDSKPPHRWPMPGGVYFIVAKKKVAGMRVIRPNWKQARLKSGLVGASQKQPMQHTQEDESLQ
jgi:SAM-dependent methyltransferase